MTNGDSFSDLTAAAREAREKAYAPYSGFAVGAALRAKSGRVFTGCNVENASYGLAICAERVAIFKAVAAGEREFDGLAVVSATLAPPCGACRQVLAEFGLDTKVIVAGLGDIHEVHTLRDLLPTAFTPNSLGSDDSGDP